MPGDPSSSIPSALTQLTHAAPLQDAEAGHLLAYPGTVPDPRAGRGRRHPLVAILAMAAAAVLTGARSVAAVAEWASDTPQPVRATLGARREAPDRYSAPSEATIRRTAVTSATTTNPSPRPTANTSHTRGPRVPGRVRPI